MYYILLYYVYHILFCNAFKKFYNTESLSQNQTVEIRSDVSNFDNSPPPTT